MKKLWVVLFVLFSLVAGQKVFAIENIVSLDEIKKEESVEVKNNDSKPLEVSITFDWLDISQAKRDEQVNHYKNLVFENNSSKIYFTKDEFKKEFSQYFKDKNYKHHYMLTNNGVTEDEDAKYCAFYYKKDVLVMYAIQYKKDPNKAFYYTAFGGLRFTDVMSDEYPNFPYTSMQYDKKGRLASAIYFVSHDLQYMYEPDKEFQGLWYKDKMYNQNGKQVLTRTNW